MNTNLWSTILFLSITACFCESKEPSLSRTQNAQEFFQRLADEGGDWVHLIQDTTRPFTQFLMHFENPDTDSLFAKISGVNRNGDTTLFWQVREFIEEDSGIVRFEQVGKIGRASGQSSFLTSKLRKANFELIYSNQAVEKHRDVHAFQSVHEIRTKSEIYDDSLQTWIVQPAIVWQRRLNIKPSEDSQRIITLF